MKRAQGISKVLSGKGRNVRARTLAGINTASRIFHGISLARRQKGEFIHLASQVV